MSEEDKLTQLTDDFRLFHNDWKGYRHEAKDLMLKQHAMFSTMAQVQRDTHNLSILPSIDKRLQEQNDNLVKPATSHKQVSYGFFFLTCGFFSFCLLLLAAIIIVDRIGDGKSFRLNRDGFEIGANQKAT